MARTFTRASSQYLEYAGIPVSAWPVTLAVWFNSDDVTVDQELIGIYDAGGTALASLRAAGAVAGDPIRLRVSDDSAGNNADATGSYSANAWTHACGVISSNTSRTCYRDGGNSGTSSTSRAFSANIDVTAMGRNSAAVSNYMSGRLAEAAIWNVALTAADVAALATGVSPLMIRPSGLVFYCPIMGVASPEPERIGRREPTVTGATAGDHYRTIMHAQQRILEGVAAAAPSGWGPLLALRNNRLVVNPN